MAEISCQGSFAEASSVKPVRANPLALAQGLMMGELDVCDFRGLPQVTVNTLEERLKNQIIGEERRAVDLIEDLRDGKANRHFVEAANNGFPEGQPRSDYIIDAQLKSIITEFARTDDKHATAPEFIGKVEERIGEMRDNAADWLRVLRGEDLSAVTPAVDTDFAMQGQRAAVTKSTFG
jgi:hypothetical protein